MSTPPTRTLPPPAESQQSTIGLGGDASALAEPAYPAAAASRYVLGAEIARGGMGIIFRAMDIAISREVAVKVLHDRHGVQSTAAKRFVDEAIAGQLQHTDVPPVHDLVTLPNGKPFLVMKLIKAQTLEDAVSARKNPGEDRGRFLAVFESLCQAISPESRHSSVRTAKRYACWPLGGHWMNALPGWIVAAPIRI